MKKQVRLLALLLMLCMLPLLAACGDASMDPETSAEAEGAAADAAPAQALPEEDPVSTTVMIYMVGSDLEQKGGNATLDLAEIYWSGVDLERSNILICAGGTTRWRNDLADPKGISLLRLTRSESLPEGAALPLSPGDPSAVTAIGGYEVEEFLPLQSMGDPDCLASFVNTCVERYPSDRCVLIFWDHGSGPVAGYGKDQNFPLDPLTLPEMRQAMDQTPFGPDRHLDWVGFDACLMASAELACVWQDYADYLLSSQETEPGFGWNYSFLSACGHSSSLDLMRAAADAFYSFGLDAFSRKQNYQENLTLSVMDLSKAKALEEAVNDLFRSAANQVSGDFIRLARARIDTRAVGRASTGTDFDLVDLLAVAGNMAKEYPEESAAVQRAVEDMVLYTVSNAPQCDGMSLYYPFYNEAYYKKDWKDTYRELSLFPDYLQYLERYETIWLGTDMQRYFSNALTLEVGAAPSTYTLQLSDEQAAVFADANYYILSRFGEGVYSLVYCSDEVKLDGNKLTASFDGRVIYFETDFRQKGIPFTRMWDTVDGVTDYSAMMILLTRGDSYGDGDESLSAEIRFSVDRSTGEMQIKGVYAAQEEEGLSVGKQEALDLSEWDVIRFYNFMPRYLIRDENGRIPYFWDWPENGWITWRQAPVADNPHFSFQPLYDDGKEYYILINIMDVQGNHYSSELFPLQLAPAPEEEVMPADTAVWTEGESVTLLDTGEVTLRIHTALAIDTAKQLYCLSAENRSDAPVVVNLGGRGTTLNGKIDCGDRYLCSLRLDPGSSDTKAMYLLSENIFLSQEERLLSLRCPCRIYRADNDATLYDGVLDLEVSHGANASVDWEPGLGAMAERQQILDLEGLQVHMLHMGLPTDSRGYSYDPSIHFSLGFENHSGSEKRLCLDGFLLNGCFLSVRKEILLQDGESWYPLASASPDSIRHLLYPGADSLQEEEEKLPRLEEISELSVCLTVDGVFHLCPVTLTVHGDEPPPAPDGELLYEDDQFQLWLSRTELLPDFRGEEHPIWYLWAVNRGDRVFYPYCSLSRDLFQAESAGMNGICPGGVTFFSVSDLSSEQDPLSISLYCSPDCQSEPIVLPAP